MTWTPIKNWPLLWKTYDHIVAHPEEWDQTEYATKRTCGTAACFAGTAVLIAEPTATFVWQADGDENFVASIAVVDGEKRAIATVAAEHLGLDPWEADVLFDGHNSLEEITRILRAWEAQGGW